MPERPAELERNEFKLKRNVSARPGLHQRAHGAQSSDSSMFTFGFYMDYSIGSVISNFTYK